MMKSISAVLLLVVALFTWPATAEVEKKRINLEVIESLAAEAAKRPFEVVKDDHLLPEALRGLSYDQYRNIRFRPDRELWRDQKLPFGMALYHVGYLYKQPVEIYEFSGDYTQDIRFSRDLFDYTGSGLDGPLPAKLGYAGLRLTYPVNRPDYYDEVGVFLGSSYFRMLGKGQVYGLSARGLALNAGIDGVAEEFPIFTHFWVGKPQPGATSVTVFSLLNSPSVAGAYQFVIQPGDQTVASVQATLFFRKKVDHVGFAPLTSMFWFGENTTRPFDDHRQEVHDSDGLAIKSASGECVWRPLRNDPSRNRTYCLSFDSIKGFGLLQRDRNLRSYEDLEAGYHQRPGLWIEPEGDWGPGSIRLVELATSNELADNVVAAWEPAKLPELGKPFRIAYKQRWTNDPNPAGASSWVVATRSGTHDWAKGARFVVLEFAGPAVANLGPEEKLSAEVTVAGKGMSLSGPARVQRYPGSNTWRVAFEIQKEGEGDPSGGAEVRCSLRRGADYISETWTGWLPL
jgi:glucans biosynthesis protein